MMPNKTLRFLLSTEECEMLLGFEETGSLLQLAQLKGRDPTIVSRTLKKISERYPVVEKRAGKWALTEVGRRINESTREAIARQTSLLNEQSTFRIGTNREFAVRVLATDLKTIQTLFPRTELSVRTFEQGCEQALLLGAIDVAFDCDRPFSPEIAYKSVIDEPIVAVAGKPFLDRHRKIIGKEQVFTLPHLLCERLHPVSILGHVETQIDVAARFNDIATTRSACIEGLGWALLPRYAVAKELESGELSIMNQKLYGKSKYGVWWMRQRKQLKPSVEKLAEWLNNQNL